MKLSPKKLLVALSLPVLMTACASLGDNVKKITIQDLQHHNWQLVQIDGKEVINTDKKKVPHLKIGEKMMTSGNAGCNNFFGQAELKDNQFRIEKMGMTKMICIDDVMDTEQAFSQTLSDWSNIIVTKDVLTLKNDVHTLTFTLRDWMK
ncbi:heat shock protein HslJ [Vibrio alginolyticus]|nr:heat shock protein HslJ [Vibrio alginolyticus]